MSISATNRFAVATVLATLSVLPAGATIMDPIVFAGADMKDGGRVVGIRESGEKAVSTKDLFSRLMRLAVAFANMDGDGVPDLVVTAETGDGPKIRIFSGRTGGELTRYFDFTGMRMPKVKTFRLNETGDTGLIIYDATTSFFRIYHYYPDLQDAYLLKSGVAFDDPTETDVLIVKHPTKDQQNVLFFGVPDDGPPHLMEYDYDEYRMDPIMGRRSILDTSPSRPVKALATPTPDAPRMVGIVSEVRDGACLKSINIDRVFVVPGAELPEPPTVQRSAGSTKILEESLWSICGGPIEASGETITVAIALRDALTSPASVKVFQTNLDLPPLVPETPKSLPHLRFGAAAPMMLAGGPPAIGSFTLFADSFGPPSIAMWAPLLAFPASPPPPPPPPAVSAPAMAGLLGLALGGLMVARRRRT